ncbi:MAG: TMEM165/GDT1 family protein, partial [Desulfobacteraceae bacterium]|nr:TMEM165/GDT1 family protein [Desulfobacteraceae bacterium]
MVELESICFDSQPAFFAELGDKTQLAVLGLSGKNHPLSVFVGG